MCSDFLQITMDNFQGDLADIFKPIPDHPGSNSTNNTTSTAAADWQLFQSWSSSISDPILNYGVSSSTTTTTPTENPFGHPFNSLGDPLLEELDMSTPPPTFFRTTTDIDDTGGGPFSHNKMIIDQDQDIMTINSSRTTLHHNNNNNSRNHNIFSRMLQISPNINGNTTTSTMTTTMTANKLPLSPPCDGPILINKVSSSSSSSSLLMSNDMINANSSSKGCLVENTALQIPSPRNTGIKRRKSQAKKVVCIPAPAPANSRPTGEVVPSDLWAWRKYGQKPIKGSPYPRGYYRCSSSKGCSARKQVERSRTDPNMLVITYTSEHNHPWPTQRNALAGSTRNQPSKNNSSTNSSSSKNSPPAQGSFQKGLKEEPKDHDVTMIVSPPISHSTSTVLDQAIKEEDEDEDDQLEKETEMDQEGGDQLGFPESYRPALPLPASDSSNHDFFADLGEIEADPLNLLFSHGFSGGDHEERDQNSKLSLDPYSFYDWAATGNHSNNTTTSTNSSSSFGEAKRVGGL